MARKVQFVETVLRDANQSLIATPLKSSPSSLCACVSTVLLSTHFLPAIPMVLIPICRTAVHLPPAATKRAASAVTVRM